MADKKQVSTRNYYNHFASDYFRSTYQANISDLWDKVIEQKSKGVILDIGCGSGRDLRYFSAKGFDVVGIDISFNLIRLAREYAKQPVAVSDMCNLPFGMSFDVAWAIGSLLHVDRINEVLSEINRVLKKDSIFIASIKKGSGCTVDEKGRYFKYYQKDEWISILTQANFQLISIEESLETRPAEKIEWITTVSRKH